MRRILLLALMAVMLNTAPALAQGGETGLPSAARLEGFRHEYQGWNNCGPATLAITLSYYSWPGDQFTAAVWLKPNPEDKNVSAWQMAEYVDRFTEERALVRYGGDLNLLRRLIVNGFPVVVTAGYEPEGYDWMGHYLLAMGYDDDAGTILTQDTFLGPDTLYSQEEFDRFWRHFNRQYLVVYPPEREAELLALLGDQADPQQNAAHALDVARQEAAANTDDPFAWFNMGTSFELLGMYAQAAVAFDQARNAGEGLPWRMLWYQFGPFEAYYHTGRFQDVLDLAAYNLATTPDGEHPIEETYYYAGLAREALGEHDRAVSNLRQAVFLNPNFAPAVEALTDIAGG